MVLHKPRPRDSPLPIGSRTSIDNVHAVRSRSSAVLIGTHHRQKLIRMRHTHISCIMNMELTDQPSAGLDLNNTGSSARSVLRRLRCVFEDRERFNISGKDSSQGSEIRRHTVNDNQRFVATRQGVVSADTDRREHCLGVAVRAHRNTGCLTVQNIERVGQVTQTRGLHAQGVGLRPQLLGKKEQRQG